MIAGVASVGLMGLCVCSGAAWLFWPKSGVSLPGGIALDNKAVVVEHLKKEVLDDTDGFEVVEWIEDKRVRVLDFDDPGQKRYQDAMTKYQLDLMNWDGKGAKPKEPDMKKHMRPTQTATVLGLRFRARNRLGGKMLLEGAFLVKDGKVVKSEARLNQPYSVSRGQLGLIEDE